MSRFGRACFKSLNADTPIALMRLTGKSFPKFKRRPVVIPLEVVPDEILEHILSFCLIREVLVISLTCRRLSRIARGALYRHVKPVTSRKAIAFFLAICIHDHIGSFVRKCELELSFNSNFDFFVSSQLSRRVCKLLTTKVAYPHQDILHKPITLAAAALEKMPSLTHLELLFPEKEIQTHYNAQLLARCPFQLAHFHTNLRFDGAMATFLKSQPHLQDFRFYSSTPFSSLDMAVLSKDMLPRLSSLSWSNRVPMELVRWLVKRRPIDTINVFLLTGAYDILDVLAVGPSSRLIKKANITFQDYRHPKYSQLDTINILFPELVYLRITMVTLTEEVINDLHRVLKNFKRLERLFLYDESHNLFLTQSAILQYAKLFWTQCSSLRRIGFYVCDPFVMVERVMSETGKSKTVLWVVESE